VNIFSKCYEKIKIRMAEKVDSDPSSPALSTMDSVTDEEFRRTSVLSKEDVDVLEKQAMDFDKESRKEGIDSGNVSLEAGLSYKKISVLPKKKKPISPKSKKKELQDCLLIVNIMRGSKLKLSPKFDGAGKIAPHFELIVALGKGTYVRAHRWKRTLDEAASWNSPDFESMEGTTAFAFKYVVGKSSQPLRIVIGQRTGDRLDILGQCVMKFPTEPLLNRSIKLNHPVGQCTRAELLKGVNFFKIEGKDMLHETIASEGDTAAHPKMGELSYKCIILRKSFLHEILTERRCIESEDASVTEDEEVFIVFKILGIDELGVRTDDKATKVYRPWAVVTSSIGNERVRSSRSKAPNVRHGGSTSWERSPDTTFTFNVKKKDVADLRFSVELRTDLGLSGRHYDTLGKFLVDGMKDVPKNRGSTRRSFTVKSAKDENVGSMHIELTILDPKEIARRCDLVAKRYKEAWSKARSKTRTAKEEKALFEKSNVQSLLRKVQKKRERTKALIREKLLKKLHRRREGKKAATSSSSVESKEKHVAAATDEKKAEEKEDQGGGVKASAANMKKASLPEAKVPVAESKVPSTKQNEEKSAKSLDTTSPRLPSSGREEEGGVPETISTKNRGCCAGGACVVS